jgi:hypothetical protein
MKFTALSMFVGVMTVQVAAGQTPVTSSELFLLRISEAQVSMRPTAGPNNVSNCMIVYPDGRLHLELRRQEFFDGKASVASYEGRLSNQELASLRSVLDSDSVRNLHMFPPPKVPFVGDGWGAFVAEIQRQTDVQKVGAFTWHGEGPKNSEEDKSVWKDAELALQPLIEWSHSVKGGRTPKWRNTRNSNSVCGQ